VTVNVSTIGSHQQVCIITFHCSRLKFFSQARRERVESFIELVESFIELVEYCSERVEFFYERVEFFYERVEFFYERVDFFSDESSFSVTSRVFQ